MTTWFRPSDLPTAWHSVPIRRVGQVLNGGTPTSEPENWGGELPFVTPPDLNGSDGAVLKSTGRTLSKTGEKGAGLAPAGSVLVSTRAPIGHVGRVAKKSAFNQGCRAVALRDGTESRYVAAALVAARAELVARGQGTTFLELSSSAFASILLPLPPIDEQRAIADYLDRETAQIDALVAKQKELIELLRERRRAAVEHALSRIEANRAALRHFSVLVAGSGFPVDLQGRADLELPFFKVANLKSADRDGVLVRSEHTIERSTAKALRATVIPKGALVFAKVGAALLLGRVGVLPDDGCIDNNMSGLIFDESIDLKFARYLVLTFDFREFVLPGPVPSLDMEGLREFKVPVLSLDRQRAVADSLDEETSRIDTLIEKAEEHIALAKERRSALITAAVTGQFDVRTARKAG